MLDLATIVRAPKALLHDHLDGGLRPATVIDLAAEYGYDALPTTDVDDLAAWFRRGADRKSLELYLETFAHTFGVMQGRDAIIRVAAECAEDLAADGVVYAEVRMAPELCTEQGLTLDEAIAAILEASGSARRARPRRGQPIVDEAARHGDAPGGPLGRGRRVRRPLARRRASSGSTSPARRRATRRPATSTPSRPIRAGELPHHDPRRRVVRAAVDLGGAPVRGRRAARARRPDRRRHHGPRRRLGRARPAGGVRPRPARPARDVPDLERPHGRRGSIAEHPIDLLRRLRYRVTVNTDNRLMSGVSLSSEFAALDAAFGIGLGEMEWLTINAMKSAFAPFDERLRLINEVVKPGYARLRAEESRVVTG